MAGLTVPVAAVSMGIAFLHKGAAQSTHPDLMPGENLQSSLDLAATALHGVTFLKVSSGALGLGWECRGNACGGDGTSGSMWCS